MKARRTIPRALVTGVLVVTACYIGLNAVYLYVLPIEAVAGSTRVAADTAEALFGFVGGAVISGLVIFSTFGMMTPPRGVGRGRAGVIHGRRNLRAALVYGSGHRHTMVVIRPQPGVTRLPGPPALRRPYQSGRPD